MSTSTTQQFDGNTIEEALGAAVASMGDDLEIVDAQRVIRRARFSRKREERYEVTAQPRRRAEAEFEDVLRRMVERVDDEERRVVDLTPPSRRGVDLADSDTSWWADADLVIPTAPSKRRRSAEIDVRDTDPAIDLDPGHRPRRARPSTGVSPEDHLFDAAGGAGTRPSGGDRAREVDVAATGAPGDHRLGTPRHSAPGEDAVSVAAAAAPPVAPVLVAAAPVVSGRPAQVAMPAGVVPSGGDALGWSIESLAAIGVPPVVLGRLQAVSPASDLEWIAALAAVIGDVLAETAATGSIELTGYGRRAAVELLDGACRGMRAGQLVIDGVRVDATPMELALGIRACLQG